MHKVLIAYDIDGTLRCDCSPVCLDIKESTLAHAMAMSTMKNTHLIAWSGGGASYAQSFVNSHSALKVLFGNNCFSKLDKHINPTIAVDDMKDFEGAPIVLVV